MRVGLLCDQPLHCRSVGVRRLVLRSGMEPHSLRLVRHVVSSQPGMFCRRLPKPHVRLRSGTSGLQCEWRLPVRQHDQRPSRLRLVRPQLHNSAVSASCLLVCFLRCQRLLRRLPGWLCVLAHWWLYARTARTERTDGVAVLLVQCEPLRERGVHADRRRWQLHLCVSLHLPRAGCCVRAVLSLPTASSVEALPRVAALMAFCLCSLGYAGWDCGSLQAAITTGVAALQVLGPIPVNGSAPALIAGSNFIALPLQRLYLSSVVQLLSGRVGGFGGCRRQQQLAPVSAVQQLQGKEWHGLRDVSAAGGYERPAGAVAAGRSHRARHARGRYCLSSPAADLHHFEGSLLQQHRRAEWGRTGWWLVVKQR